MDYVVQLLSDTEMFTHFEQDGVAPEVVEFT
jgi:hypothetical protein